MIFTIRLKRKTKLLTDAVDFISMVIEAVSEKLVVAISLLVVFNEVG